MTKRKEKISDELNDLFITFLEDVSPKRLSNNLRKILLRYLIYEHEALPSFFGSSYLISICYSIYLIRQKKNTLLGRVIT